MTISEAEWRPAEAKQRRKAAERVIDCDVHPTVPNAFPRIFPYLSQGWQRKLEHLEHAADAIRQPLRYYHPLGKNAHIADAATPTGGYPGSDPAFFAQDLFDARGVDIGLLIVLEMGYCAIASPDAAMSAALLSAWNDYMIEQWLVDPRMRLALGVSPLDPELAVAEIKRHGSHPQVAAVFLPTGNTRFGNRHFHPIYEASVEHGLPIVTHVAGCEGTFQGGAQLAGGLPESYIELRSDWSQVAQGNVSSLILRGTFERYKELKFVFVEYGFSWAIPMVWRLDKTWRELRGVEAPWLKKWPSEYMRDHIRLGTQPLEEPANPRDLDMLIENYISDSLVFSSDYPHWDIDEPSLVLRTLSDETKKKIFFENAESTLRL